MISRCLTKGLLKPGATSDLCYVSLFSERGGKSQGLLLSPCCVSLFRLKGC